MTYKLTATITHKSFGEPVVKEMYYTGDSKENVLAQIEMDAKTPPNLIFNLRHHGKCAFKDIRGVKHSWSLKHMEELN